MAIRKFSSSSLLNTYQKNAKLSDGFTFHNKHFTPHNNYGIIDIHKDNSIYCSWVKSLDNEKYLPTVSEPIFYNYVTKERGGRCGCCLLL